MICPTCNHDNLPGAEVCGRCLQDLTQLDQPAAANRVERSLMEDPVRSLGPRQPVTARPGTTVRQAVQTMLAEDIGALLVVDDAGKLLGVFSERDLMMCLGERYDALADQPVAQFMTPKPETVAADDPLLY